MSTETEFKRWLRRPDHTLMENFRFALKAWQSADFTHSGKYELVLSWLVEQQSQMAEIATREDFPEAEFKTLLQLRAPPGLIEEQTKRQFIDLMLQLTAVVTLQQSRLAAELLQLLLEFELLQDVLRTDYELQARVTSQLLQHYEGYMRSSKTKNTTTEFFASVLKQLHDTIKRVGDNKKYDRSYCRHIVQPLTQLVALHELSFFDELLQLERLLTVDYDDKQLLERLLRMPLHVRLLILECSIINRRGLETFLQQLLQQTLGQLASMERDTEQRQPEVVLALTATAYTLEMLRKHDANLNFALTETEESKTALAYVGEQLLPLVRDCKERYLYEVLLLLSAALRLNPLILEQDIFQVTTWMILAPKPDVNEQQMFDVYLVLLMDMFRRLSRAEKLVFNLLKSLKEWLSKYQLPGESRTKEKNKRKLQTENNSPATKKTKLNASMDESKNSEECDIDFYLQIIFKDFHKPLDLADLNATQVATQQSSFPQLRNAWPNHSAGVAFSRLITGLVSKPSLVIWKSLIYSFKELIEEQQQQSQQNDSAETSLSANSLFLLDLHAALLCQYFMGSRLAEQCDKFHPEITAQRRLTHEVLGQFGHFILSEAHNRRTLHAFLECGYHAANFELVLAYYLPDGLTAETIDTQSLAAELHRYLTAEEWAAIQQRVFNFGKGGCHLLLNRLLLQRSQAKWLLQSNDCLPPVRVQKTLHCSVSEVSEQQLERLLERMPGGVWFLKQLERDEKAVLLQQLLFKRELLKGLVPQLDLECVELLSIAAYGHLGESFAGASKGYLLGALCPEVQTLLTNPPNEVNAAEKRMQQWADVVQKHAQKTHKVKPLEAEEEMHSILELLAMLPLGYVRRPSKNFIFTLQLALYSDLCVAGAEGEGVKAFEILTDLLHFGQHVPIFKYFFSTNMFKLLPVTRCWAFYEFVFASIKNEERGTEQFLNTLAEILTTAQSESEKLTDEQRRLLLKAIETLAASSGPSAKRMRKQLESFLAIYHRYIRAHFAHTDQEDGGNSKKDKKFVEKTLSGFAAYANVILVGAANNMDKKEDGTVVISEVDEEFRRVCKIYIGHSMDYRNPCAIRLLQVALNQRQLLHLDQDEIEFVLSHYWQQLNEDLKLPTTTMRNVDKHTETVVKLIIGNKTNEDLLLTLQSLLTLIEDEKNYANTLRCLELIAKCPFSTIKGAIFNEKFKQICAHITLHLAKDEKQQFKNDEVVGALLAAQHSIAENKMIPISLDTLDDMLAFLMDINIKKFPLTDSNTKQFHHLHLAMTELCSALIRQRHILLMDRVPQFMHIFKDLTQSIVWYKSERQKDIALSAQELDDLAELAIKLEALSHLIAAHSLHVKRVAPFMLTFVINLMVANKRTTTLYPKIKTHLESICYDLIGICDHRVGRFILRCSNEAARQVYEVMVKDHKKYHKFKGKI